MRHRQSSIKSMSPSLFGALCAAITGLLLLGACGEDKKQPVAPEGSALALPTGVLHRPNSPLSPGLILEPRPGKPHLLHVQIELPEGQQLLRLRVLGAAPGFEELANKDMSQLDGLVVKEEFEIPVASKERKARHVLVIADYSGASYGAGQALPGF